MIDLGKINTLAVSRIGPYGTYLDGENFGEVLLGRAGGKKSHSLGDRLEVFVYMDSDETVVASLVYPLILAGECKALRVVALTDYGAFLEWGLTSDLFVPRSEQMGDMRVGSTCVVVAMIDESSQRMIASARLYDYLDEQGAGVFKPGQAVALLVCQHTDLGYKAVVDGTHLGVLYNNELFRDVHIGDQLSGYVKTVRADGKIDLVLQKPGQGARGELESRIIDYLKSNNGVSSLTDKSPPQDIYNTYGVSKKAYKAAVGGLYRSRLITIGKTQIQLATLDG